MVLFMKVSVNSNLKFRSYIHLSTKFTFIYLWPKGCVTWHIVRLTISHHLFLEFWLFNAWFFAHWRRQRAATRLKNVRPLIIRRGKKLGFQWIRKLQIIIASIWNIPLFIYLSISCSLSLFIFVYFQTNHL